MLGGSTGDDSYDHTITDKVQAYSPQEQTWSVEVRQLCENNVTPLSISSN